MITIIITIMYTIDSITWTFCKISFKLAISPIISKELLRSIDLFSVQFQGTYNWSVQIFKGIVRSVQLKGYYCSISRKVAIDRSKFSKELGDRSTLNAITLEKVAIDQFKFSKELGDRSQNITYKIKTDDTLDSAKIGQFLPFYTHLHSSFLVDSVLFVQTQYEADMNLFIILIF